MARVFILIALALFASAAASVTSSGCRYNEDEMALIDERVVSCIRDVSEVVDEDNDDDLNCLQRAYLAVLFQNATKEDLARVLVGCLRQRPIDSSIVDGVEKCIVREMARDV